MSCFTDNSNGLGNKQNLFKLSQNYKVLNYHLPGIHIKYFAIHTYLRRSMSSMVKNS